MSSSRRDERSSANQDFIAKIRYGNHLPPPSNPPKLLNIANDALSQYCKVDFTNRLARENFNNVEADVESGMPLDVWGLPGVFDGDDSAMLAQDNPTLHPSDKELIVPLSQIGRKSATTTTGPVSFLRRTEYIAGRTKTTTHKQGSGIRHHSDNKPTEAFDEHDSVTMLAAILKSFDTANPDTADPSNSSLGANDPRLAEAEKAWKNPVHPQKKNLKVVETFPLFPDYAGAGDFHSIRFNASPVPPSTTRDERLDMGLFNIIEDKTGTAYFDYYLPDKSVPVSKIRTAFSVPPPPNMDSLPGGSEEKPISYNRVREYESISTINLTTGDTNAEYTLVFHDDPVTGEKAAYYYPLQTKMTLRPKRNDQVMNAMFRGKSEAGRGFRDDEEPKADILKITVRDMTEEEKARRERNPLEEGGDVEGEVDADGEVDE